MKRIISITLTGIGVLFFLAVGAWIYFNNLITHPTAISLPGQVAGLRLNEYQIGARAAPEIVKLHGKEFPIASGAIGIFGDNQITVWAAGAPLNSIASRMVETMQTEIVQGRSPFTPVAQFNQGNRIVYVLEGRGQRHYYFQSKNRVIWLAVDAAIADDAIQQILEAFP